VITVALAAAWMAAAVAQTAVMWWLVRRELARSVAAFRAMRDTDVAGSRLEALAGVPGDTGPALQVVR
jgi:hypothetical protein